MFHDALILFSLSIAAQNSAIVWTFAVSVWRPLFLTVSACARVWLQVSCPCSWCFGILVPSLFQKGKPRRSLPHPTPHSSYQASSTVENLISVSLGRFPAGRNLINCLFSPLDMHTLFLLVFKIFLFYAIIF